MSTGNTTSQLLDFRVICKHIPDPFAASSLRLVSLYLPTRSLRTGILHKIASVDYAVLDHPNITVLTGVDYREIVRSVKHSELVYTGPVDEYFDYRHGKLPYRSLRFRHEQVNREIFNPRPS